MKDFTVTVTNPERATDWQNILGRTTVVVQSPIPQRANLPGHHDSLIYLLDLEVLTTEEVDRLVEHLARRFDIPQSDVARDLREMGVPILADDCIVTVSNPQRWF
jgi:DNA-binding transcriptional regulator YbjK